MEVRDLYTENYDKLRGENLGRFWRDTIVEPDILQLTEEDLIFRANQEEEMAAAAALRQAEASARLAAPSTERRAAAVATAVSGAENAAADQDVFVRPQGSDKCVAESADGPVEDPPPSSVLEDSSIGEAAAVQDESAQCSVDVYENGTATSPSNDESRSAASSCEPNFRNCLSQATVHKDLSGTDAAVVAVVETPPLAQATPTQATPVEATAVEATPAEATAVEATPAEATPVGATPTEATPTEEATPIEATPAEAAPKEAASVEPSVEKRAPAPKYKLPRAVLKPDNLRAVRYWEGQRRSVVPGRVRFGALARPAKEQLEVERRRQQHGADDGGGGGGGSECGVLHAGRPLGVHDVLGQRVLQVTLATQDPFR